MTGLKEIAGKYKIDERLSKQELQQLLIAKCDKLSISDKAVLLASLYTKPQLCELLSENRADNVASTKTKSLNADSSDQSSIKTNTFIDQNYRHFEDYLTADENDDKVVKVKKLASGVQGTILSMRIGRVNFARKNYKENFGKRVNSVDAMFKRKKAFENEMCIEIASSLLLTQCIIQDICPHFPFTYSVNVEQGVVTHDMQLLQGVTLGRWSQSSRKTQEWFSVIFQILVALYCMQEHFGMIHDDLHDENVMVTKCTKATVFEYHIRGRKYHVPLYGNFVQIIDFGRVYTPKNKIKIPWHVKHRQDSRKTRDVFAFDYRWLLEDVLESSSKKVQRDLEKNLFFYLLEAHLQPLEMLDTLFSSEIHGKQQCGTFPCYDKKSKEKPSAIFDLTKAFDKSKVDQDLKGFCRRRS